MSEWISVKSRLPEDNVHVLVYVKENNPASGDNYFDLDAVEDGYWINILDYEDRAAVTGVPPGTIYSKPEVTHWMPLPEPPND